jgi:hypothetical protein
MLNVMEFLSVVQKVKFGDLFFFFTLCTLLEEWMQIYEYILGLRPRGKFKRNELTGSGDILIVKPTRCTNFSNLFLE